MELIKKTNFDFMGKRKIAYLFSIIVILWGMTTFFIRGKKNFGVDFTGGDLLQIAFKNSVSVSEIRDTLSTLNIGSFTVQAVGTEEKEVIIKSNPNTSDTILKAIQQKYGQDIEIKNKAIISPSMSTSLRNKALFSFLLGIIGILIYLAIRFEFRFAVGATVAIFHDLLFVISILAIAGKQIDSTIIAALLTIAGYSVNDTVVIFDRIRENVRKTRSDNYIGIFNLSINETLSRTILTGLTTIVVVILFFFFGGESLHDFAFSLLVGFIIGTFSSVFVASALVIDWHRIRPYKIKL
ncbi:MAG TPA: protein translocase subunit SecF [Candidatus Ratteibacteria bacterium]|nr:protein translocase subunit SecF [Candidatus Ratteibacteria bacterium]